MLPVQRRYGCLRQALEAAGIALDSYRLPFLFAVHVFLDCSGAIVFPSVVNLGNRIRNMHPGSVPQSSSILPPCAPTAHSAMDNPKPVPPFSRDLALSTR